MKKIYENVLGGNMKGKLLIIVGMFVILQFSYSEECKMSRFPNYKINEKIGETNVININNKQIDCLNKQRIGESNYYKDTTGVYLDATYSSLYAGWVWLEKLNPNTIVYLDQNYIKDDKYVYSYAGIIEGADAKSFQVLDKGYSKDKNNVYFNGELIDRL